MLKNEMTVGKGDMVQKKEGKGRGCRYLMVPQGEKAGQAAQGAKALVTICVGVL